MLKRKFLWLAIILMAGIIFSSNNVSAIAKESKDVIELKKQIKALQKRVEELEADKGDTIYRPKNTFRRRFGADWDTFEEMDLMQEEMNRIFKNYFGRSGIDRGAFSSNMSFNYDFDLKENKDGYEIRFDMAGLDKEKIDIEINEHSITVKGEHSKQDIEESSDRYFSSKSFRRFMKTIPLPMDADTTKIKTEKEGDTLVIRLPKKKI